MIEISPQRKKQELFLSALLAGATDGKERTTSEMAQLIGAVDNASASGVLNRLMEKLIIDRHPWRLRKRRKGGSNPFLWRMVRK